jgi:hypothetical protein
VRLVYFDLAFLGQESVDAAEAAHCAQDQDKFWEYHDLLYASDGDYKRENLDKFAQQLGLNMTQFGQCMDTHKYKDFIAAEAAEARRNGVTSTPTLFVNRTPVPGFVAFNTERAERSMLVAPGVTLTDESKLAVGKTLCLSGEVDSNRRISKGAVTDPPGNDDTLCGLVKGFTPSSADRAGEITLEQEVPGLKQIIEEELKKR